MKRERMTVENSRCINCKHCECRDDDRYFCVAKSSRGVSLNGVSTILRQANGRDFPYFCPLPNHRKIIDEDIKKRKESAKQNRVDTCAKELVFALVKADIAHAKWEPTMLDGKTYRLEFNILEVEK